MNDNDLPEFTGISKPLDDCNAQKWSVLSGGGRSGNNGNNGNDEVPSTSANDICGIMSTLEAAYDLSASPRQIRPNYISVTGWIAGSHDHDPVHFESSLEQDCAFLAMFESRITSVKAQPYTILYTDKNDRRRKYTPDFEFTYLESGRTKKAVIEVKPEKVLKENSEKFCERFTAMEELAVSNGHSFHVLTEAQLRIARILNTKSLFARWYDREVDGDRISIFFEILEPFLPCKIDDALQLTGFSQEKMAEAQSHIWALIAGFEVYVDLDEEITFSTVLQKRRLTSERALFFKDSEPWNI